MGLQTTAQQKVDESFALGLLAKYYHRFLKEKK